jgi:ferredoxin
MNLMAITHRLLRSRFDMEAVFAQEDAIASLPGAVRATDRSPERFEIFLRALEMDNIRPPMTLRTMPHMIGSRLGMSRSLTSVRDNPEQPRTHMPAHELRLLESYAQSQDVAAVGYARLPRRLVFRRKAVLFGNAIVLVMEMDKGKIDTAPAPRASEAVHETYHRLGDAANRIAGYLRRLGFAAHAGHPLNGLALYPPLGQMAGLGWRGRHGMLITPQFGPRCRLAAVFTSVQNLPFFEGANEHRWIEGHCATCGKCMRMCPAGAILGEPVQRENGLVMCVDATKCFPYFVETFGCSVCIKVCPFNRVRYDVIKQRRQD